MEDSNWGFAGAVWVGRDTDVGVVDGNWGHEEEVDSEPGADLGDMGGIGRHTGEGGVEDSGDCWGDSGVDAGDNGEVLDPFFCKKEV